MKTLMTFVMIALSLFNDLEAHANSTKNIIGKCDLKHPILTRNWTLVDLGESVNSLNWERVASSISGKHQTAVVRDDTNGGNIYLSHDWGRSWSPSPYDFTLSWEGVAVSGSGRYQTAVAEEDSIYTSRDHGKTWRQVPNTQGNWVSVAVSKEGKYQTAVANSYFSPSGADKGILVSSDYGSTWQSVSFPNSWIAVTVSRDGRLQTAVSFLIEGVSDPFNRQGFVYQSKDFGRTWQVNSSLPQGYYTMTTMSANGHIQIVGETDCNLAPATPGPIFISYNKGKTFRKSSAPLQNWLNASISHNGRFILAISYEQSDADGNLMPGTGVMASSSNFGRTWEKTNAPQNSWTSVLLSRNGCIATATAWGSGIFIKQKSKR